METVTTKNPSDVFTMPQRKPDLLLMLTFLPLFLLSIPQGGVAEVCRDPTSLELDQKLDALYSAFEKGRSQVDLIILIDRSKSVTNATNVVMMEGVSSLIDILVTTSRLYIHPDLGRIALLSYGATITAEFEGISSDERTFDSCEVESRISSLRTQDTQETNTKVWQALQRAAQIFTARRSELKTSGGLAHKQMLWTFYDGDANEEDAEDEEKVKVEVGKLAGQGVVLFSAAIGHTPTGWLDTTEEENRVKELAKDIDHFACVETWTELLRDNTPTDIESLEEPVYAHINTDAGLTPAQCVTCPLWCVCDVIHRDYSCVSCEVLGNCDNVTSSVVSSDVTPSTQQVLRETELLRQTWFVVVLAVLVSVIFFLLCSVLVALVCSFRHRHRKSPDKPPLPLPPKRYNLREMHIMADPVYTNTGQLQRPISGYGGESNWEEEEMDLGKEQDQTVVEYHTNMPDWDRFLYTEVSRSSLHHLAVYSLDHNASAWTPGFQLPVRHVKTISKALSRKSLYKRPTIKVGDKSFLVDKASVTPTKISAHSLSSGSDPECVHISKVGKFLVVGVASADMMDSCQKKVAEISQHLEEEPNMQEIPRGGVSIEGGVINRGLLQETL